MMPDASPPSTEPAPGCSADSLERWRSRVTRWSIAVMATAIVVFFVTGALRLPAAAEFALFAALVAVGIRWVLLLRAGRCPRCGARVRLEPRLVLPARCAACGGDFAAPPDERSDSGTR